MTAAATEGWASSTGRRSAARMAAAQVLYEMEMAGASADAVLADQLKNRWTAGLPAVPLTDDDTGKPDRDTVLPGPPDPVFLGAIVRGVVDRRFAEAGLDAATAGGAVARHHARRRL